MKYSILISVSLVLSCLCSHAQEDRKTFLNKVNSIDGTLPEGYVPPLVSNGNLSMLVDYTGGQFQEEYVKMIPEIYWAGRRYNQKTYPLIPFGHFNQEYKVNGQVYKQPDSWEQTLDTKKAVVSCSNKYGDIFIVETDVFIHLLYDMVVIKKRFYTKAPGESSLKAAFNYQFTPPGYENSPSEGVKSKCQWNDKTQSIEFRYEVDSYKPAKGIISVFSDQKITPVVDGQSVSLVSEIGLDANNPSEITYYLLFSDTMDGEDYLERQTNMQEYIRDSGYTKILATHIAEWAQYWDDSFVNLPDEQMEKAYNTAQYNLRTIATKWSFPIGISPRLWSGRYFAFDESFILQALVSSNHLQVSRRCPEFRYSILSGAKKRVAHYGRPGSFGARYNWLILEDGAESVRDAFELDHVFHMSNIAMSCWLQYLYSNDIKYLKSIGYPVIMECARFYVSHMVYEDCDGRMFIGKCTDLERLGPAVQNPFMTACGAIYTLEAAAKASGILGTDTEETKKWKHIAAKLRENLPFEDGRYIPYKGCKERSVASLGGLFPYPIFDSGNTLQRNAVYDFVREGRASGNMYPVGNSICAWYSGWIASALALLGDKNETEKLLLEAVSTSGCFSEFFEINEPEVKKRPWFSTASGNYIYAINQMFLQNKERQILIAPAVPDSWENFSFELACYGGLTASVTVKDGLVKKLRLKAGVSNTQQQRTLIIPEKFISKEIIKNLKFPAKIEKGYCSIDVLVKREAIIL
jgi:hypothetical protein